MSHVFRVWAPEKQRLFLHLLSPVNELLEMRREPGTGGYFSLEVPMAKPGSRYQYLLEDSNEYPDPASHYQPEGVHGPSEVVDHAAYVWKSSQWVHRPFSEWVLYEIHVGTFTPEGTFEAIIPRLDTLVSLGVNALEIMPVAQFPGERNWGYDGAYPYAVQAGYGGPVGLKRLVDSCHARGIAVVLDVVYNHLGPEGNYAGNFGPYFTGEYRTPWGGAFNLDGAGAEGVRNFLIENMHHWFQNYRIDALRLDAIHAIYDKSAIHFWEEVREKVEVWKRNLDRPLLLIAESDLNNPRVVTSTERGGFGFDAQWLDDFHHALYTLIDPEGNRHYEDFGSVAQLAKAYNKGFVHSGEYVKARKRRHGAPSEHVSPERFVVFNQNHDQTGNRVQGERLSQLVDADRLKVAAAALLLSPYVPMLFMGEEYGEIQPFQFFADYRDPDVCQGMQEGRKREFASFQWEGAAPPDPLSPETFLNCKLAWERHDQGHHAELWRWHRDLLAMRLRGPFHRMHREDVSAEVLADEPSRRGLALHRKGAMQEAVCLFNFSETPIQFSLPEGEPWQIQLHSRDAAENLAANSNGTLGIAGWTAIVLLRDRRI